MEKRKIIFVGGVHGVGKTTFCKTVASKLEIKHFSASDLIALERQEEHRLDKQVENVNKNQDLLLAAINKYFHNSKWSFLDGHFCLLSKDGQIKKIEISTFENINPSAIVVLFEKPEIIVSRLNNRDNIEHNLSTLKSFQEQEVSYAKHVSKILGVPYLSYNASSGENKMISFIKQLIMQGVS